MNILFHSLDPAFYGAFGAIMVTRLAVKLLNHWKWEPLRDFQRQLLRFHEKYPQVKIIAFIFSVAICVVSAVAGLITSLAFGIFYGITVDIIQHKKILEMKQAQLKRG